MADRVDRDVVDAKITFLRLKHRRKDGSVDMSEDSPLHAEFTEWYEGQNLSLNFGRMALRDLASYYERHKAYQDVEKLEEETGSLFEDEKLVALSLDRAEHIEMGELIRPLHIKHNMVLTTELARQINAANKKLGYNTQWIGAYQNDTEKLRDVEKRIVRRLRKPKGDKGLDQAAD